MPKLQELIYKGSPTSNIVLLNSMVNLPLN